MKRTILVLALVFFAPVSMLTFACPPPPTPGYEGVPPGDGPAPSGEVGTTGGGDTDDGSAPAPVDVGTGLITL